MLCYYCRVADQSSSTTLIIPQSLLERRMGEERLLHRQALFQAIHGKHIHLKLPSDKLTSVVIPLAFVATTFALMFRGMWHMTHGTGKN
jgi:hypothetical protein